MEGRKRHDGRFIVADGHARDSMGGNEDVFAEFDGWQVMAKRKNGDEERGRVFIGFDDYTISREIDERQRGEREGRGAATKGRSVEFDEWQDEMNIMHRDDEKAREIWRGREEYDYIAESIKVYLKKLESVKWLLSDLEANLFQFVYK